MEKLAGIGVWAQELRYGEPDRIRPAAAELDELGYTALWVPDLGGDLFGSLDLLLDATRDAVVATGILNLWMHEPAEVGAWWGGLEVRARDRVLLGIGVSHGPFIGERYAKPLTVMADYLDALERSGVPLVQVCLAALGPRMLELAASRTAGAHPYLVDPRHTRLARTALGDRLLAVEQGVVLDDDHARGLTTAREGMGGYADLPNYANSWRRLGYTEADVSDRSDALVEGLVAIGDASVARARVDAHVAAGADHVCLQVITPPGELFPLDTWRRLAPA